jgi:ubiquinone/menaquinone biosynthesis C-methylase UbiE
MSEVMGAVEPICNDSYGRIGYWDDRYTDLSKPYDWLFQYSDVSSYFERLCRCSDPASAESLSALQIGCGNAPFSADLHAAGLFGRLVNTDTSAVAIEQMAEMHPLMEWAVADATHLEYKDKSFDAVIDKGCIDSVLCSENETEAVQRVLQEALRVLRPTGNFIIMSLHKPNALLPYLLCEPSQHFVVAWMNVTNYEADKSRSQAHTLVCIRHRTLAATASSGDNAVANAVAASLLQDQLRLRSLLLVAYYDSDIRRPGRVHGREHDREHACPTPLIHTASYPTDAPWTQPEQSQLECAMRALISSAPSADGSRLAAEEGRATMSKTFWRAVSARMGRSARECAQRYKKCALELKCDAAARQEHLVRAQAATRI